MNTQDRVAASTQNISEGDGTGETLPPRESRLCSAFTQGGKPCQTNALSGSSFCFFHDPAAVQRRIAASRKGGQKKRLPALPPDTPDFPLNSARDAGALLDRTINQLLRGKLDPRIANAVGYLLTVKLKAEDKGELEGRVAALESTLSKNTRTFPVAKIS